MNERGYYALIVSMCVVMVVLAYSTRGWVQ